MLETPENFDLSLPTVFSACITQNSHTNRLFWGFL